MTKNHKSIRSTALKTMRELRPEMNESDFRLSFLSTAESQGGVHKPWLPIDATLARLIERIKNL